MGGNMSKRADNGLIGGFFVCLSVKIAVPDRENGVGNVILLINNI